MKVRIRELAIRFFLGGIAVTISYLLTIGSPWGLLGGAFAAFPAVMVSAIMIAGLTGGSEQAGNIARGAIYGMLGGVVCVVATLLGLILLQSWFLSLIIGISAWFIVSLTTYRLFHDPYKIS